MIRFLLCFLFSFSVMANELDIFKQTDEELCVYNPKSQLDQFSKVALKYSSSYCKDYSQDAFFNAQMGCFTGIAKGTKHAITSFGDLVRFVLIDNPVYDVYKMAFYEFAKIAKGEYSPSDMANQFANANMRSQADIWAQSKKYLEQFKAFSIDFKNELLREIEGFSCLPIEKQNEIICRGVTEVFFLAVSPAKFVKGAKWGIDHLKALKNFIVDTKAINGLSNMSVAQRLDLAAKALKESKNIKEVMKFRDSRLIEEVMPDGEKVLKVEYKVTGADGKQHLVRREVTTDVNTKAINSKEGLGAVVLEQMIKQNNAKGAVVFIDINHLGKANYFEKTGSLPSNTAGGDLYLANVADAIRKHLRPGDVVFKHGGDELVIVLNTNNPQAIKNISQRIINEVDAHPQIRQYFKSQVMKVKESYQSVNKARGLSDIPEELTKNLTSAELDLAKKNFAEFKKQKLAQLKTDLQDQARYRGSVSPGASLIREGDSVEAVVDRAESQAKVVKANYKAKYGLMEDVKKYQVQGVEEGARRHGPAVAVEPN